MPARAKKNGMDLCTGPFLKKIILYTLPIIATSLLQLLFNAADLVVVGQFRGPNAVSAVGSTGSLINLIVGLFMGLSIGVGVCVAQAVGARDHARMSRAVHTALPAAAICGAFLTVVGICFCRFFLELMDTPAAVIDGATIYMQIYFAGIIPILLYNFGAAILRSAGDSQSPLVYLVIAGTANVCLNLAFVLGFGMSVEGVALATTLSQVLSCFLVLRKLALREDGCRLDLKKLKIHMPTLGKIIRVGLPAGIQGTLFAVSNVTIQSSINSFGEVVLSGSTAASNIEGFVYMSMNGFQQSATTFAGQNMGARRYQNLGRIVGLCIGCAAVVGIVLGGGAFLFAEQLLPLYLKTDVQAIGYGITRMRYVCLLYFLCGMMDVLSGAMRGMGQAIVPMIVAIVGACLLRVVWVMTIFKAIPTLHCLFLSYPVSWVITVCAMLLCFMHLWRKTMKSNTMQNDK